MAALQQSDFVMQFVTFSCGRKYSCIGNAAALQLMDLNSYNMNSASIKLVVNQSKLSRKTKQSKTYICPFRQWVGKTSPEYEYRAKHQINAHKN